MSTSVCEPLWQMEVEGADGAGIVFILTDVAPYRRVDPREQGPVDVDICQIPRVQQANPKNEASEPAQRARLNVFINSFDGCVSAIGVPTAVPTFASRASTTAPSLTVASLREQENP